MAGVNSTPARDRIKRRATLVDKKFDGDEVNCMLLLDNFMTEKMEPLKPYKSTFSMDRPYEVSNNLSIPKPVIATTGNWLHTEEPVDPVKWQKTLALAE